MKAVFRISTRIRSAAPIPRGFLEIPGLEHLGLIYEQKVVTDAAEFNAILATISDRRFASRGCEFFPYMLSPEEEALADKGLRIIASREEAAAKAYQAATAAAEAEAESAAEEVAETASCDPDDEPQAEESVEIVTESTGTVTEDPPSEETATEAPSFRLEDGRKIMVGGERVGGLFGDEKQLRVLAAYADLRPQIEAWLSTLTNPDQ